VTSCLSGIRSGACRGTRRTRLRNNLTTLYSTSVIWWACTPMKVRRTTWQARSDDYSGRVVCWGGGKLRLPVHHAWFNGDVRQTCKALVTENQRHSRAIPSLRGMRWGFYPEFLLRQRADLVGFFNRTGWLTCGSSCMLTSTKVQAVLKHIKRSSPKVKAHARRQERPFAKETNHWQSGHWRWCSEDKSPPIGPRCILAVTYFSEKCCIAAI
jgi:hypothetical protein